MVIECFLIFDHEGQNIKSLDAETEEKEQLRIVFSVESGVKASKDAGSVEILHSAFSFFLNPEAKDPDRKGCYLPFVSSMHI